MENVNKSLGLSNDLRLKNVDVERNAQVIVDLTTVIDAPLQTVWSLQTDINQWPSWQQDITQAQLFGPLAEGSTFKWVTHGLQIDSTISQVDPLRRIVWGGPALGIDGVHVWAFEFTPKGTVVNTTESWDGPPVEADPDGMKAQLTASLKAWLAVLKKTAEAAN